MVPSRQAGKFYSLAQSPQQFKQMLMVGGMDRYFQFARCYRDEDLRSDRQPEFTQLDLEMSFVEQCGIQSLVEELLAHLWKEVLPDITLSYPFQRVTYNHAIDKYGSDKPDTSFGWTLNDVTREARNDIACVEVICSFVVPSGSKFISDSLIKKEVTRIMKEWKLNIEETNSETVGFAVFRIGANRRWCCILKQREWHDISENTSQNLNESLQLIQDDLVFLAWGESTSAAHVLGHLRLLFADVAEQNNYPLERKKGHNFLWVTDFPLFTKTKSGYESEHHPFTAPLPEHVDLAVADPLKVCL
jgi:aspartyl-tRNA synthetase